MVIIDWCLVITLTLVAVGQLNPPAGKSVWLLAVATTPVCGVEGRINFAQHWFALTSTASKDGW